MAFPHLRTYVRRLHPGNFRIGGGGATPVSGVTTTVSHWRCFHLSIASDEYPCYVYPAASGIAVLLSSTTNEGPRPPGIPID